MSQNTPPESNKKNKIARSALQAIGGGIPFAGGVFSAIAGAWSEKEQEKINQYLEYQIKMIEDEFKEVGEVIIEIMNRLDLEDENILRRIESKEYQSIAKKTFRDWGGTESKEKRKLIRNILTNAAASTDVSSDDVVRMFINWISLYSELHFQVISAIYNSNGISRGEIWDKIGKEQVREDSADADLYKLLFRDLSTGGIIRQHRKVDYHGNLIKNTPSRNSKNGKMKSAFDREESYELTALGQQFIHYAMTDLPPKIESSENQT